jgi:two-component system OmpR family response regulator
MLANAIALALTQSANVVDVAHSGEEADHVLHKPAYDLVLLDIALPRMDGTEVLRRLRARRSGVPVIVITVRDAVEDRVRMLDMGADDYLCKPFQLSELEARVRALVRRSHGEATSQVVHGRLTLDIAGRRLYADGRPVELSMRELEVMELLLLKEGRIVTKQQIIDHLYGWEEGADSNTVAVFIYRLRKRFEPYGVNIRTVRGMGYIIEKPRAQ